MSTVDSKPFGEQGLCSIDEAAAFLGVSRSTIYAMLSKGELPEVKLLKGKLRRIPKAVLIQIANGGSSK
jgi:excisionase family DNA binding protein